MQSSVERMRICFDTTFKSKHIKYLDQQRQNKGHTLARNASSLPRTSVSLRRQVQPLCLLLWVFVSLMPVESAQYTLYSSQRPPVREVKIGVILTHASGRPHFAKLPFTREMVLPAIIYSVEKLLREPILPRVKFIISERDSNCSNSNGPLAAIDFYRRKEAHLFMGPACDYAVAPVARYSGRWGIPVITAGALFQSFSDKTEFPALTRVQGSFHKVKEMFQETLKHFNWTRIGMLFYEDINYLGGPKLECLQTLRPIFDMFAVKPHYISVQEANVTDWRKYVATLSNNSRSE